MTPKMKKLLSQLRKELAELPEQYANAVAVENELQACLSRVREIRATEGVLVSSEFLKTFEKVLNDTPEGLRDETWRGAMTAIQETLKNG